MLEKSSASLRKATLSAGETLCTLVQREIRQRVEMSRDQAGDLRLPSERALAEELEVSRLTVRNAYQALVAEGLLVCEQRGYRLPRTRQEEGVLTLAGFTRGIRGKESVTTKVLAVGLVRPAAVVLEWLEAGWSEEIVRLERLRLHGGQPYQLERCYLRAAQFPGIVEEEKLSSLYDLFEHRYGFRVLRAEQTLEVISPDEDMAKILKLRPSDPLLSIRRCSYDQKNAPLEYVEIYLNPQGRKFTMELK